MATARSSKASSVADSPWTTGNMRVAFFRELCRGVGGNESLAGRLHRGCNNIHGDDPSGWRKHARRDRTVRNAGSVCEHRDAQQACALHGRAGGIRRTWNSAWSRAWLGAWGAFRTGWPKLKSRILPRQNPWPWATMMPPNPCRQRAMTPTRRR